MKRKGFTIVELLVVIAIIGVLIGLVSVAVGASVRNGRAKRANAMCNVVQQAITMYYSKKGEWPKAIEAKANNMSGNSDKYTFSPSEADTILRELVSKSTGSGASMALLDASALFVAKTSSLKNNGEGCYDNHGLKNLKTYCGDKNCAHGLDFATAIKKGKSHIPVDNMSFGFQATRSGKFSRFWITYNSKTDSVTVTRKNPDMGDEYPNDWE